MFLSRTGRHQAPGGRKATKALIATVMGVMLAGVSVAPAMATQPEIICNEAGFEVKVDTTGDPATVSYPSEAYPLPEGKLIGGYCVKAGDTKQVVLFDEPVSSVLIDHTEVDSVSHWQVLLVDAPKKTATAAVVITDAGCELGEQINYAGVLGATASGTPSGTYGPGDYSVTFTADAGYTFPGGNTLVFSGTLAGPLDPSNPDCGPPVQTVTVSVSTNPATCEVSETLVVTSSANVTLTGTPNGTEGPGSYSVTATADPGYEFSPGVTTLEFSGTLAGPLDPSDPNCGPEEEERNPVFPIFSPDCDPTTGEFSILFIATGELVDVTTGLYENEFSFIQVTVGPTTASATVTPKDGFVLAPPSEGGVQYVLNEDGSVTYSVDFTAFAEECGEDEEPQFISPPPVGASYDCISEEIDLDLGGATLQEDGSYRWEFGSFRVFIDGPEVTFSFLTDPGFLFPEPGEGDTYTLVQGEGELGSDAVIVIDLTSEIEACDDVEPVPSTGDIQVRCLEGDNVEVVFSGSVPEDGETTEFEARVNGEVVSTETVEPDGTFNALGNYGVFEGLTLELFINGELAETVEVEEGFCGDIVLPPSPSADLSSDCGYADVDIDYPAGEGDERTWEVRADGTPLDTIALMPGESFEERYTFPEDFNGGSVTVTVGEVDAPVEPLSVVVDTDCKPPVVIPPVDPPKNPEPPVNNPPEPPTYNPPPRLAETGAANMNGVLMLGMLVMIAGIGGVIYRRVHSAA